VKEIDSGKLSERIKQYRKERKYFITLSKIKKRRRLIYIGIID